MTNRTSISWLAALLTVVLVAPATASQGTTQAKERPATEDGATAAPPDGPLGGDDTSAPGAAAAATSASAAQAGTDDDGNFEPWQPDFTIVALPTTLRLPRWKSAFRVTHRFNRPLGQGDFGSLVEDFFGFDSGAQIGLEYRIGLAKGWQVGLHRTSDRTIEFFTQYNVLKEGSSAPVTVDVLAVAVGSNNFKGTDPNTPTGKGSRSPGIGAVVSRSLGQVGGVYAVPMFVHNTNLLPGELVDANNTFVLGLGGRIRVRPTVYVVGEIMPRLSGYDPGVNQASIGIEKRAGGHSFQINFSNGIGTSWGQIARGGGSNDDWFLGFNISRKFF